MIQLVVVTGAGVLARVVSALDGGPLDAGPDRRRVLVVADVAPEPEVDPLMGTAGVANLLGAFHSVVDWNAAIAPFHPADFERVGDPWVAQRWLRSHWSLGNGPVELILEPPLRPPGRVLAAIFLDAPLVVYGTGPDAPTTDDLDWHVADRVTRIVQFGVEGGSADPQPG